MGSSSTTAAASSSVRPRWVGDNCTLYQAYTGRRWTKKGKRHPTIGNNVLIGAGAKILGAFEVGDNCQIAANAVLLKPLEENSTAAGIPARQVKKDGVPVKDPSKKINTEHICKMPGDHRRAGASGERAGEGAGKGEGGAVAE